MNQPHFISTQEECQTQEFKRKALEWAQRFPYSCYLDGNGYDQYPHKPFRNLLAVGHELLKGVDAETWESLTKREPHAWYFGYLSYDLKDRLFTTSTNPQDGLQFPLASFFKAEMVLEWTEVGLMIWGGDQALIESIWQTEVSEKQPIQIAQLKSFWNKATYLNKVQEIQEGIRDGWVYEVNLCRFFEYEPAVDGLQAYLELQTLSPMPFSGLYRFPGFSIASASPERYLKKEGQQLISQPIKGTAARGKTEIEDTQNKEALRNSEKERAENLMIVDLVRNDLCRVSTVGSTEVSELFGIYSFPQVHQMISTIESNLRPGLGDMEAIRSTFPMGSMTGAPKPEVIQWIERLENYRRGAFSGALGYFAPGGDFDFNVLIRSLFTNHQLGKSGFAVGSAITIDSEPEEEWQECENKALAIKTILGQGKI